MFCKHKITLYDPFSSLRDFYFKATCKSPLHTFAGQHPTHVIVYSCIFTSHILKQNLSNKYISILLFVVKVWVQYVCCKKSLLPCVLQKRVLCPCNLNRYVILRLRLFCKWFFLLTKRSRMLRLLPSESVWFNFVCILWQWHSNLLCLKPCQCLFACYNKINH